MILTADSGSTKTTWLVNDGRSFKTQGLNPFHMTEEQMEHVIQEELLGQEHFPSSSIITEIHFYGAGCTKEKAPQLSALLKKAFPEASKIEVGSDMLGAARALFNRNEGIACILGTGANSCLYDGNGIVANVPPMGYILGDEGSGAVLGRNLVNLLYKGGHGDFIPVFEKETGLTSGIIIEKVYRAPMANRFLASLTPFIKAHIDKEWMEEMVVESFRLFFRNNVRHYGRPDLACSFVGSIAFHFETQLRMAAKEEGSLIGTVMKEPLGVS